MVRERVTDNWLELSTASGARIKVLGNAHPRSKRLRLTITPGGARVSYPQGTHPARVSAFLRQHADWLERELGEQRQRLKPLSRLNVGRETEMPLRGRQVPLRWSEGPYPRIQRDADDAVVLVLPRLQPRFLPVARGLLAAFLEDRIRRDVGRWMPRYVPQLGHAPTALRVRPMQSQWGSLDTRDRINLDLSLALAPAAALRYVLVHELCHLKVRDHSPRFWRQVGELDPGWEAQRAWLRDHGAELKLQIERLVDDIAD
ncbi:MULTISPECIES: SprT family zinc-dependent metalloprotease [Oleiagrimonas]|uniref:M48 family metallopeptidase n=1 Tax=Oleiagrimonas citrea TaxID=1665687 RepID=A0A846ZQT6_9GAMM|nr:MULTISPECIES: SprT family zinc-dependent metalloprotease [Oleiagrimonas]NKZ39763.1 M48 family metallopeptidase [Oleiagrimonas citrea]RAP57204.1 metal-dependent hydrolase [Oleiagrimonas sp. MCCC 1A03011]